MTIYTFLFILKLISFSRIFHSISRAFPPLHKKFDIDLNKRGISVYVAD